MSELDLSRLTPQQEQPLLAAFRYLRERAAWLRAQKAGNADTCQDATLPAETESGQTDPTRLIVSPTKRSAKTR